MDGEWSQGQVIIDHFANLLTEQGATVPFGVLDALKVPVLEEINTDLDRDYAEEEIKEALKQINPLKAPGPYGIAPIFFQRFWPTMGSSVTQAILHALKSGIIPSFLNHTHVLIPKKKSPEVVGDFRPISLCNVMYKIISKVIDNHLKKWMLVFIAG